MVEPLIGFLSEVRFLGLQGNTRVEETNSDKYSSLLWCKINIIIIHVDSMENVRQVVARVVLSVFMRKYFIFRVSFFKPSIKIVSAGKY